MSKGKPSRVPWSGKPAVQAPQQLDNRFLSVMKYLILDGQCLSHLQVLHFPRVCPSTTVCVTSLL